MITHLTGDNPSWDCIGSKQDNLSTFHSANERYFKVCSENRAHLEKDAKRYYLSNLKENIGKAGFDCKLTDDDYNKIKEKGYSLRSKKIILDQILDSDIRKKIPDDLFEKIEEDFEKKTTLPPHIHNPICGVSLDYADNISIVLSSTIGHAVSSLEKSDLPIHQLCISFCPNLESLGIDTSSSSSFYEVADLYNKSGSKIKNLLPFHPEFEEKPLIAITYYRFNPLCTLGSGQLFQEAIIRSIHKRIEQSKRELICGNDILKKDDIRDFGCTFLCPIGWADLATVMFASNYSTIIRMLHDIRQLTFDDLYSIMDGLYGDQNIIKKMVNEFQLNKAFAKFESIHNNFNVSLDDQYLPGNHVFSSTATSFIIEHHSFIDDADNPRYHGIVSADPHFDVSPGHIDEVKDMKSIYIDSMTRNIYNNNGLDDLDNLDIKEWLCSGKYDSSDKFIFLPNSTNKMYLKDFVDRFKRLKGWKSVQRTSENVWPIRDMYVELFIPLPNFDNSDDKSETKFHLNIHPLLKEIKYRLFENDERYDNKGSIDFSNNTFNLFTLKRCICDLRLPWPLSSKLLGLYVDFSKCIQDPLLVDNVIDIYDLYAAIYRIFVHEYPKELSNRIRGYEKNPTMIESIKYSFFDKEHLDEIVEVVELMENAIKYRMQIGFKQAQQYQQAIDLRGGLNKLVNAADVPLKCGFSIIRRILQGQVKTVYGHKVYDDSGETYTEFRTRFGGSSNISNSTGAVTKRFNVGDKEKNFVAELNLNVAHLTKPSFLLNHLHETGHLIFDVIRRSQNITNRKMCIRKCTQRKCFFTAASKTLEKQDIERNERFEEIFADMFTYCLLTKDHDDFYKTYSKSYISMYYLDPTSMTENSQITLLRFSEISIRLFLTLDPSLSNNHPEFFTKFSVYDDHQKQNKPNIKVATERYISFLETAGPFFIEFNRFWNNPTTKKYLLKRFQKIYKKSYFTICCMWKIIEEIVNGVCKQTNEFGEQGTNPIDDDLNVLLQSFERSYDEGRPIIRFLYNDPRWEGINRKNIEKRGHLDVLFVMRNLLKIHIEKLFEIFASEEDGIQKEICYSNKIPENGMSVYMLDKGKNGLRAFDFEKSEKYLKGRACVLTTLWDLSTAIRARIMTRVIVNIAPELKDELDLIDFN